MEFTVNVAGGPGAGEKKADEVLWALEREPGALGPGIGVDADGSLSSAFQVDAATMAEAASVGASAFAVALRSAGVEPRVTHLEVWEGDADADPHMRSSG